MTISETIDGQVAITTNDVTIMISQAEAFDLLDWLYDRRDQLYRANQATWDEETWELHRKAEALMHAKDAPARADKIIRLRDFTQEEYQEFADKQAAKHASAPSFQENADGHISYSESQLKRLCPYCGDQGVLYSGPERDDADFQAYQCANSHIFYVSKDANA